MTTQPRIKIFNHRVPAKDASANYNKSLYDKNLRFLLDKATAMGASAADDTRSELRRKADDWFDPSEREGVMSQCMQAAKAAFGRAS